MTLNATITSPVSGNQIRERQLLMDVLVHLEGIGDSFYHEDEFAGTRGQSRRLEGFQLSFNPGLVDLGMQYMAHLEGTADTGWYTDGQFCGTRGQSRRLEGFAIKLTGKHASEFTVQYMAHLQGTADTSWYSDGQFCGTRGESRRVEGICVKILKN
jgi:uncharacterized protein YjdB